jgi:hypothetical protein
MASLTLRQAARGAWANRWNSWGQVPASPGRGIGWQRPQSSVAIPVKETTNSAIQHEQSRPRTRLERTTTDPLVYLQALDMRPALIRPSPSMPQMPPQQWGRLRRSQDNAAQVSG